MIIKFNDLQSHPGPPSEELSEKLQSVLQQGRYLFGPEQAEFERRFAEYLGQEQVIGISNGTDAIELTLRGLGIGINDLVVSVANAGGYAACAAHAVGARSLFCDVERDTGLISMESLSAALAESPSALVITHLYGRMVDMTKVFALADQYRVPVIEDCAQAHGADYTLAPIAESDSNQKRLLCFSFYPSKNLGALGDAGAIATNDPELAGTIRTLSQYGWADKYNIQINYGRNSRMDEIQAAALNLRLGYLDSNNKRRRQIASAYRAKIDNRYIQCDQPTPGYDVEHLFIVRSSDRQALQKHLNHCGIETGIHYPIPDHLQFGWRQDYKEIKLPITERRAAEILSLPCHPGLTEQEVQHVIQSCNQFKA